MPNEFGNMLLPSNDSGIGGREPGGNGGRLLELELELELELKLLLDMAMEVELGTGLPKTSQGMFIVLCLCGLWVWHRGAGSVGGMLVVEALVPGFPLGWQ